MHSELEFEFFPSYLIFDCFVIILAIYLEHVATNVRFFSSQSLIPAVYKFFLTKNHIFTFPRLHVWSHYQPHRNCSNASQKTLRCFKLDHRQPLNTTFNKIQHFLESGKRCLIWWEDEWAWVNTEHTVTKNSQPGRSTALVSSAHRNDVGMLWDLAPHLLPATPCNRNQGDHLWCALMVSQTAQGWETCQGNPLSPRAQTRQSSHRKKNSRSLWLWGKQKKSL